MWVFTPPVRWRLQHSRGNGIVFMQQLEDAGCFFNQPTKPGYFQPHVGIFSCLLLQKWTACLWRQKELPASIKAREWNTSFGYDVSGTNKRFGWTDESLHHLKLKSFHHHLLLTEWRTCLNLTTVLQHIRVSQKQTLPTYILEIGSKSGQIFTETSGGRWSEAADLQVDRELRDKRSSLSLLQKDRL